MAKAQRSHKLSVEFNSQEFHGSRTVEGSRLLYQSVEYKGRTKHDGACYKRGEEATMQSIARVILLELVREAGDLATERSD